jgi:hypothetical protein
LQSGNETQQEESGGEGGSKVSDAKPPASVEAVKEAAAGKGEGKGDGEGDKPPGGGMSKNTQDLLNLLVVTGGVKGSLAVVLGAFVGINALGQVSGKINQLPSQLPTQPTPTPPLHAVSVSLAHTCAFIHRRRCMCTAVSLSLTHTRACI